MSDLHAQLLQQMLAGQQPDPGEMSRMFAEHEDPRVRLIAQFMSQSAGPAEAAAVAEDAAEADVIEVEPSRPAIAARRVRDRLRMLTEDLRIAQTVGDTLAAALGACYLCWGEDSDCEYCGGAGRPGWEKPDPELFAVYVAPAIERLHQVSDPTGPAERSNLNVPRAGDGRSNRRQS